jgi:threonine dehydrogenase-like Zn-dependent dehydrogenase
VKAACWFGKQDVRVTDVPDPDLINSRDAIVKITSSAICGSDLHLYNGLIPTMQSGDILGHEFMGEVIDRGSGVDDLALGDRVVIPFPIACGKCFFCHDQQFSLCENSNPNAWMAEKMWGHSPCGIFGYSHMLGGYAGGQAQYVRVPYADVNHVKVPEGLTDEQVLFLSDILPTGWMAAENCDIRPGETVAVWGCGPVGLLAIQSAFLLGAGRVIAIDRFAYRLQMASEHCGAETLNYEDVDVYEALREMTGNRGPDACIDAVGMEAHMHGAYGMYDRVKQALMLESDRPPVLRQAITAVRSGGHVSVAGVYGGLVDKVPFGAVVNKALTIKSGQTHVQRYMQPLLQRIEKGEIDTSYIVTHTLPLDRAPEGYATFLAKAENCVKVVLKPNDYDHAGLTQGTA